ncbi:unnamed protein product [Paramecium pentaurelia]|uniref:Uncharacterized protein n=1 Tax=Paramecium pentaurelia TaxID=43138 RepID=A0A8S1S1S2_9CILI|nr:unnamed protein product [Paramecium pentaurelia]
MVKAKKLNDPETPLKQIKKRNFIDPQFKLGLINSVVIDHLPIYQAAILHKIKYSSAKHIIRNYLSDKDNFFSKQKKNKREMIINNLKVIIDVNSGKIKIIKTNHTILYKKQQQNNNQTIINNILSDLSHCLLKEIVRSQNSHLKYPQYFKLKLPQIYLSFDQQLSKIKTILNIQHQQMNSK